MWELPLVFLFAFVAMPTGQRVGFEPFSRFERGVIYQQRSYVYTNTRDLDVVQAAADLQAIGAKGFQNVGLRVSWGDVMMQWDAQTSTPTYNESFCDKLSHLAQLAAANGMRLIFNVHLAENVPEGTPDAVWKPGFEDVFGVFHRGTWRVGNDLMVREDYRQPITLFHTKFAACLSNHSDGVLYWKHAFESCYLFPNKVNPKTVPAANAAFAMWAKANNSDLGHWMRRWNETIQSWDNITIPHSAKENAKNGDFFRFWLLGVLKEGRFGLSIREIMAALRQGAAGKYEPQLGFKHWRPANFYRTTDLTVDELRNAYDLPINVTALGYYCNDKASLSQEPGLFEEYVKNVQHLAPEGKPILVWETGASTFELSEDDQVKWARIVNATIKQYGLLGFNWWQFVDWAPKKENFTDSDQYHFGLHYDNGTAKKAWDWFQPGNR